MDVTNNAFQPTTDGSDFYLMVLEDDASALHYASFFGGPISDEHVDGGTSRFDRRGKIYQSVCAGCPTCYQCPGNHDFPIKPNPGAVSPLNNNRCNNGVFKFDFEMPYIEARFSYPSQECRLDLTVPFSNHSREHRETNYWWDFGDGTTSTEFSPRHTYSLPGTYEVSLAIIDTLTCNLGDTLRRTLVLEPQFYDLITLDISTDRDTIFRTQSTILHIFPQGENFTYEWSPTESLNNHLIASPIATPMETTTYRVSVYDANNNACRLDTSITIYVEEVVCGPPNIFIPNAFTPNGDNNNDLLYVRGENIDEFYFTVYNRWGEMVFETTDQNEGWDGTYKGRKLDPDVYVYYLKATCIGQAEYFHKGNVTLIR